MKLSERTVAGFPGLIRGPHAGMLARVLGHVDGLRGLLGQLEGGEWAPDFGERKIHPTAGVVAVGARMPLIAYNVNLDTSDLEIASKIAKAIRCSSGGFKYCKAIGVMLEGRNIAQVSMNLVNYEGTPIYYVFEMGRVFLPARRQGADHGREGRAEGPLQSRGGPAAGGRRCP